MAEVQTKFKCQYCGGSLDEQIAKSTDGIVECEWCMTKYNRSNICTIPRKEADEETRSLIVSGRQELDIGDFNRAYELFRRAADRDRSEPEAFFGMALAKFRVRYLKDHKEHRMQPICYDTARSRFSESKQYLNALSIATSKQRVEYARQAEEIDHIHEEFNRLRDEQRRYDCFICVKVTEDDERRVKTKDSDRAAEIYNLLRENGYHPFYSEYEVRGRTGVDYEALILYALHTSECMLIVCTNPDYLDTPWVQNEYTRFLKLIGDEKKESDAITFVFDDKPIEYLPGRSGKLQGISLRDSMWAYKLIGYVEQHTPEARRRRAEAEERRKQEEEKKKQELAELSEQLAAQVKQQEDMRRAFLEQQEGMRRAILEQQEAQQGVHSTVGNILTRAQQELESGYYDQAAQFYNTVLEADARSPEAWWGLFLAHNKVAAPEDLIRRYEDRPDSLEALMTTKDYRFAHEYAGGGVVAQKLEEFSSMVEDAKAAHEEKLRQEAERRRLEEERRAEERRRREEEKRQNEIRTRQEKIESLQGKNAEIAATLDVTGKQLTEVREDIELLNHQLAEQRQKSAKYEADIAALTASPGGALGKVFKWLRRIGILLVVAYTIAALAWSTDLLAVTYMGGLPDAWGFDEWFIGLPRMYLEIRLFGFNIGHFVAILMLMSVGAVAWCVAMYVVEGVIRIIAFPFHKKKEDGPRRTAGAAIGDTLIGFCNFVGKLCILALVLLEAYLVACVFWENGKLAEGFLFGAFDASDSDVLPIAMHDTFFGEGFSFGLHVFMLLVWGGAIAVAMLIAKFILRRILLLFSKPFTRARRANATAWRQEQDKIAVEIRRIENEIGYRKKEQTTLKGKETRLKNDRASNEKAIADTQRELSQICGK